MKYYPIICLCASLALVGVGLTIYLFRSASNKKQQDVAIETTSQ